MLPPKCGNSAELLAFVPLHSSLSLRSPQIPDCNVYEHLQNSELTAHESSVVSQTHPWKQLCHLPPGKWVPDACKLPSHTEHTHAEPATVTLPPRPPHPWLFLTISLRETRKTNSNSDALLKFQLPQPHRAGLVLS